MQAMLHRLSDLTILRYLLASVGALAVDMGSFLGLMALGLAATPASAAGYTLGILAHWLLSSRAVFTGRVAQSGIARTRQKVLFVVSALAGLALTTGIVAAAQALSIDPRAGKLVAIVLSFALTWWLRNVVVFRALA
ncbi:GtrA family protein [Citromicrobium bathyomarinum]|uniref:GtrA family protein n=1 Tax=Sphingomonadales TaxID=204457 RepID=UPI0001DD07D7|nr:MULTISPECIES: GtrA family protein [Sphingomonadales]MAO05037.1 GtrA family protein [Citromicrobium sp.]ALG59583.1 polysaccharide biosynthesis protein GtrA [Citromicrobium sp. JL477]KPM16929.1 polysaccharide biosynthesis protein GtrA [Citromicrobium sp. WPS32]KPM17310.1 polysaccharide biosynthesis protein GtrA [Citromicrobium sp. JL1351]KPM20248.1 polysaccharide biosynthesis protein GtrA [Citromicrobium sp. JL31]|tara:strand:- start:1303 stop:1713 length:411 start_codon:yes stop_codon:yes gene_type:complete